MSAAIGKTTAPSTTQGFLKIAGNLNRIPILGFSFDVEAPRDVHTGLSSGKRQHQPLVVRKEWDSSSPVLLGYAKSNTCFRR